MDVGQIYSNVILGQIQPALNHNDPVTGFQEFVDLKTLQMWKDSITDDLPVNLEHDWSIMSSLVPFVGLVPKESVKILGDKLVGDFHVAKEAFTESMYFIGKAINDILAEGKDKIMFSLQGKAMTEQDPSKKLSLLRPTVTDGAALTELGAATTQFSLAAKEFKLSAKLNPEIQKKLSGTVINTITKSGEINMSDNKVSIEDVNKKVEAAKDGAAEVKDTVEKLAADTGWQDDFMSAMKDLHGKVDKLHEMCAKMSGNPEVAKPLVAETKLSAEEPKKSTIEVKLSADIGNMSDAPAKETDISDEELSKNWKKYYLKGTPEQKKRVEKLARKNSIA